MTTRKSGPRRRGDLSRLTADQKEELFRGRSFVDCLAFTSLDDMRVAWELHRDDLRDEWSLNNPPATRCFAEWLFEITPKFGERPLTPAARKLISPAMADRWRRHGILHTNTTPPMQEPQHEFLYQHGLIDGPEYVDAVSMSQTANS